MPQIRSSFHLLDELAVIIRKPRWDEAGAQAVLQAQRASGLSVVAFARKAGLSVHRLHNWRKKLRCRAETPAARPPRFLPVSVVADAGCKSPQDARGGLEVLLAGGRRIHVAGPFDSSVLTELVKTLEALAC